MRVEPWLDDVEKQEQSIDANLPLVYSSSMSTAALNYKNLPISERIELVEDIWDSIAEETSGSVELDPQQLTELRRRLAAHQGDPASSIPWEQVRAALFKGQA